MPIHVGRYSNSSKNLYNRYIHLTNYSVNRHNAGYEPNSDEEACQGHKWYEKLDVCGYMRFEICEDGLYHYNVSWCVMSRYSVNQSKPFHQLYMICSYWLISEAVL